MILILSFVNVKNYVINKVNPFVNTVIGSN